MPSIAGINLSNGITMNLGGSPAVTIAYPISSFPTTGTIAQREATINAWWASRIAAGDQFQCHIYSTSPWKYTVIVANKYDSSTGLSYVIPADWWV